MEKTFAFYIVGSSLFMTQIVYVNAKTKRQTTTQEKAGEKIHLLSESPNKGSEVADLTIEQIESLENAAYELYKKGDYGGAAKFYETTTIWRQNSQGLENLDTVGAFNDLAILYYQMGLFSRAGTILNRSLAIQERVLGADHTSTGRQLTTLL